MKKFRIFLLLSLFFSNCLSAPPTLTPIPDGPASVAENVFNVVLNVSWNPNDPDGGTTFSYSQNTSGPHDQYFSVNSDNGKITVKRALNYEDTIFNGIAYVGKYNFSSFLEYQLCLNLNYSFI